MGQKIEHIISIGGLQRRDDHYRAVFDYVNVTTWLNSLLEEVQKPPRRRPTKPPKALVPTHDHKKLGLRFVAPARVGVSELQQILEAVPILAQEHMKLLLTVQRNKPLRIPRGDMSDPNWLDEENKLRLWYRRVNRTLPKCNVSGKRYRLIENSQPTGSYLQLWETEGKMNSSYALPNIERHRKTA